MKVSPKTKSVGIKAVERVPKTVSKYKQTTHRMLEETESPDAYAADMISYGVERSFHEAKTQLDRNIKLGSKQYSKRKDPPQTNSQRKRKPTKQAERPPKRTQAATRRERQVRESAAKRIKQVIRAITSKFNAESVTIIFACLLAVLLAIILVCASSMLMGEMGYVSNDLKDRSVWQT